MLIDEKIINEKINVDALKRTKIKLNVKLKRNTLKKIKTQTSSIAHNVNLPGQGLVTSLILFSVFPDGYSISHTHTVQYSHESTL